MSQCFLHSLLLLFGKNPPPELHFAAEVSLYTQKLGKGISAARASRLHSTLLLGNIYCTGVQNSKNKVQFVATNNDFQNT